MASCYMCNRQSASVEHVPPRCLFPEQKDLPAGVDLRKQLITVPACDLHNTAKSKDDEYLLYVLVMNLPANTIAKNHFLTKLMRAVNRNPGLMRGIVSTPTSVIAVDEISGEEHHTVAVRVDDKRVDSALEHMARALYFHHFQKKWFGRVKTQAEFFLVSLDPQDARELNEPGERIAATADQIFAGAEYFGENPDVFKYQMVGGNERIPHLMRLHFYDGGRVTVFFLGDGEQSEEPDEA
jgi:hypothetical protein